jgi:mannose-1-phosphate guanylyltransferase
MSRRWVVILAGGDGVRLRSMTRGLTGDDRPKQFCALVGPDALLTETRRRAALVAPAHRTLVVVNRAHERFYTPLLADLRARAVAPQPENRGTAPGILYALLVLAGARRRGIRWRSCRRITSSPTMPRSWGRWSRPSMAARAAPIS